MAAPPPAAERMISNVLGDYQKLIAALKIQRWDATKWAVTVNFALATAAATLHNTRWVAALMAVIVSSLGTALVYHYNSRATRTRETLRAAAEWLRLNTFDYYEALKISNNDKTINYDFQELIIFTISILASALPTLAIWIAS